MRNWIYDFTLKPIFFRFNPEDAHELSRNLLNLTRAIPGMLTLVEEACTYRSPRLQTKVFGIDFPNPLGMAAGFDKTGDLYPFLGKLGFGFVEIGTITGEEQPGNPKPRLFRYEEEQSLVNRMGFNNPGADKAYETISKQEKTIPRGINAGKTKLVPAEEAAGDYIKTFQKLSHLCDYGVINISSPNTPGLRNFQEKDSLINLVNGIKEGLDGKFPIPMLVKFAPDLEDKVFEELLDIVVDLKLDGIVITNTTVDVSVLPNHSNVEAGGISGRVLKEKSTHFIRLARQKLQGRIPIIGVGGIYDGPSALEKILAGSDIIQIYTGYIYGGPFLPYKILKYLDNFLAKQGISNLIEIVGNEKKILLSKKYI